MTTVTEESLLGSVGVAALKRACLRAKQILREVDFLDVGIDAFWEVTENLSATGKLVGVQVKTGKSFVTGDRFHFRADRDHLAYWATARFPVIAVIHDDATDRSAWIDVTGTVASIDDWNISGRTLEVEYGSETAFDAETIVTTVIPTIEPYFLPPRQTPPTIVAAGNEIQSALSADEEWFALIGAVVGLSAPLPVSVDAVQRLSQHLDRVDDEKRGSLRGILENTSNFQVLRIVEVTNRLEEIGDSSAAEHMLHLLDGVESFAPKLERLVVEDHFPQEDRAMAIKMIEVITETERLDLWATQSG